MHYVRHRGVVSGPFDTASLQVLVRRAALSRIHQISCGDGKWVPAERFFELFGGPQKLGAGEAVEQPLGPGDELYPAGFMPLNEPVFDLAAVVDQPRPAYAGTRAPLSPTLMAFAVVAGVLVIATTAIIAYYLTRPDAATTQDRPPQLHPPAVLSAAATSEVAANPRAGNVLPAVVSSVESLPERAVPVAPIAPASPAAPVVRTSVQGIDEEAKIARSVGLVVCGAIVSRRGGPTSEVPSAEGSCFAVTPDGYLLTNRHVVDEIQKMSDGRASRDGSLRRQGIEVRPKVWVFFAGAKYEATIVYVSASADVAVLKIDRQQSFFRLSVGGKAQRNEDVFAIGFPGIAMQPLSEAEFDRQAEDDSRRASDVTEYFKPRDFEFTLTRGVLGRTYAAEGGITWIQHEATLRHGNSGGPLVNKSGIVLGINTRLQTSKQDVQTNLSLEISQLKDELNQHAPGLVWE